jgi:Phospholipase_D-nuclease N-terminal
MLRLLPMLVILGLALVALIDCLARDDDEIRGLPKVVWVFVILLFPLIGSLAWFLAGRPTSILAGPLWRSGDDAATPEPPRRRPLAPDDDPDFLRGLRNRRPRDDDETA